MIGYKVVRFELNSWYSVKTGFPYAVEYGIGKKTTPIHNAGDLCVFDTLENARSWINPYDSSRIFECEYDPSDKTEIWTNKLITPLGFLPKGTRLAKSVILKRQVI